MTRAQHKRHHRFIARAVEQNRTQAGGIYTDDLIHSTGMHRAVITNWLKANGFRKDGGCSSRYWQAAVVG
jgi:hypothetical protein